MLRPSRSKEIDSALQKKIRPGEKRMPQKVFYVLS
jgi:hypothetical protein